MVNTSRISPSVRRLYAAESALPIRYDCDAIHGMGIEVVEAELMGKRWAGKEHRSKARHDAAAVASVTMALAERGRARRSASAAKNPAAQRVRQTGR